MAHAYTPGLKVADSITLFKRRILPLKGEIIVELNANVKPDDVVARTFLPGEVHPLNAANVLNILPEEVPGSMLKQEKEPVKKGEIIAETKGLFGLFKSRLAASIDGTIESISGVTGQVLLRGDSIPVEVQSYIRGQVVELIEEQGVVVKTCGAFVQGIFGVGGETFGKLRMVCSGPSEVLSADKITKEHRECIIVGGSLVTKDALKKAIESGVRAVVVGGFDDKDLRDFLGYDLGVAITGSEELGITLIVTEGFGRMNMAEGTFELLKSREGKEASVSGATQIRAGVLRPEIIITDGSDSSSGDDESGKINQGLLEGMQVRVIRQPYFGRIGKVVSLPSELFVLESGSKARVVEVEFSDGSSGKIPRANVELIER